MRHSTTIAAVIGLALMGAPASAQLLFQVCGETCPNPLTNPVGAAQCQARISACETKLTLYNSYMAQLGAGVTTYQLPALYRSVLQPFYPGVNLANWRYGFSDRQPANNATTDCSVTYFNRAGFVSGLRAGTLNASWNWLFHELRHFGQCLAGGGRDAYAKMWFGQLEVAFIQNNNLATLHDRMPMEANAASVASGVVTATVPLRDLNNRLVRPIAVTLANGAGQTLGDAYPASIGTTQRLTAQVTGGSVPLENAWAWRVPGSTVFASVPANVVDGGRAFQFVPTTAGTYAVRVRVSQPGSNLVPATRLVSINVLAPIRVAR